MSLNINVGGTWKTPTPWINVGGTWKKPSAIWANVAGVWKAVWSAMTAALSTYSRYASGASTTFQFPAVTCSVSGNQGSVTYSWSVVDGGPGDGSWSIYSGQGTASASAIMDGGSPGGQQLGYLTCTVTADGQSITTGVCQLSYSNTQLT